MKVRDFAKIYFSILILHLVTLFKDDFGVLFWLSKPLIISTLLFYFLAWSQHVRLWVAIILALVASLVGDVLLMFKGNDQFFIGGILAYGAGELFYFVYHARFWQKSKFSYTFPGLILGLLILFLIFYLAPQAHNYWQVYLYIGGAVLHLSVAGHNAIGKIRSYWCFWGALLYLLSDVFLIYNKFGPLSQYLTMLATALYAMGQFAIIYGILQSGLRPPRRRAEDDAPSLSAV